MASARGAMVPLAWRRARRRRPPLVVLCDISGSMDRYSRMLLFFLHAITNDRDRVHTLLFGTRLTNITRHLKHRDVDVAIARVSDCGHRLGGRHAHRRLPGRIQPPLVAAAAGQGAIVLLISDGLDSDVGDGLAQEMERLAQVLPAADLAQSAAALRGLRGAARGHSRDAAVRRRFPAGAQPAEPEAVGHRIRPPTRRPRPGCRAATRRVMHI